MNPEYRDAVAAMDPYGLGEHLDHLTWSVYDRLTELEMGHASTEQGLEHRRTIDGVVADARDWLDALEVVFARIHAMPESQHPVILRGFLADLTHRLQTLVHTAQRRHEHDLANTHAPQRQQAEHTTPNHGRQDKPGPSASKAADNNPEPKPPSNSPGATP